MKTSNYLKKVTPEAMKAAATKRGWHYSRGVPGRFEEWEQADGMTMMIVMKSSFGDYARRVWGTINDMTVKNDNTDPLLFIQCLLELLEPDDRKALLEELTCSTSQQ